MARARLDVHRASKNQGCVRGTVLVRPLQHPIPKTMGGLSAVGRPHLSNPTRNVFPAEKGGTGDSDCMMFPIPAIAHYDLDG
ncbi:hypothetical protein NDU88_007111 [Pleurodeles waltl]|uniref:Uncharacterized protein n=1 Tax=Pleurodeles waltl TaxID=8319 RepID=A0AAV7RPY5_PLEWA|nr:hypothetical protein NDU88_007111 [Pleurodeles waltl]